MAEESKSKKQKTKPKVSRSAHNSLTLNDIAHNLKSSKMTRKPRNSISISIEPPDPHDIEMEERRLSHSPLPSENDSHSDDEHLLPPPEEDPHEIVQNLVYQRRPSTITNLSDIIKNIYIDKKVKEDGIPSLIMDRLYLGSIGAAKNLEWLKSNGVTHILCVAGGIDRYYPKQFVYKVIEINDAPNEDISAHFSACSQFIDDALSKPNQSILVHCFAGMSRSVTVVSAYLMLKQRIFAVPALKMVKDKRSVANPNAGFIVQLIKYQNVLGLKAKEKSQKTPNKIVVENVDNDEKKNENDQNDKEEEQNIEDDGNKLSQKLNSSMVKQWENGRRPSLFTALAKLRGLKNRTPSASRENSMDFDNANEDKKNALKDIISPKGLKLLREVSDENDTPINETPDDTGMGSVTPLDDNEDVSFGDMANAKKQNDDE